MSQRVSYSTARILARYNKIILATGSGFFYRRNGRLYLVTAWHNLAGRHSESLETLSKAAALPNNILVDVPIFAHNMYARMPISIDLEKDDTAIYLVHEQIYPRVDVAIIEIQRDAAYTVEADVSDGSKRVFPIVLDSSGPSTVTVPYLENVPRPGWDDHEAGDDLFIIGYPEGLTDQYVNPLWKRGTIASNYKVGWLDEKRFLIDSATRPGLSGGPAIYYSKSGHPPGLGLTTVGTPYYVVHGIYVGRIGGSTFEAQIGSVWKLSVVDEIIAHNTYAIPSSDLILPETVISAALDNYKSVLSDGYDYSQDSPRLYALVAQIMKDIKGRANPEKVASIIKEAASHSRPQEN